MKIGFEALTPRELEVVLGIARGEDRMGIADRLGFSGKTFDTHRLHATRKLGVRNNVELARLALREGRVTL